MTIEPNQKYNIVQPLILACIMAIGIMVGFKLKGNQNRAGLIAKLDTDHGFYQTGRVEELLRFIDSKYVDQIDVDTLLDDAIYALIENLDPHSEYLTPEEVEDVQNQMEGHFRGMGIEIIMIRDTAHIYKVLEESPAKKSGLLPGDKIILVSEVNVAGVSKPFSEIRELMKKTMGETVLLQIRREGKVLNFKVPVHEINVPSVSSAYNVNDSLMYIKIDRFGENTYQHFMNKVEKLIGLSKQKHLIIDLRGNPGGYLPEATNILSQIFEDKNKLLVTTISKNDKKSEYKTTGKRFFNIGKVAVLVDENSASASEIIAGAIQDWDRGVIIGRRTYGKGLVQEQYDLNNGGAIRLTVARYFTPSGRSIQRDYKNKLVYDDDHNHRINNGDYFKSEVDDVKDSSQVYYSFIKKRKLKSEGGISPDIFVPLDSMLFHEKYVELETKLIEYYLFNMHTKPYVGLNSYEAIKDFTLSVGEFQKFLLYAKMELTETEQKRFFPLTEKFMRMVVANVRLNDEKSIALENHYDPGYQSALLYFKNN